ncbi:FAD/NAD(P)-binding protein [Rhizobium sp. TRM95796]|uniref:FAD/NAD(P)-binding protein n=1 Tax=Rhizobium sp. TRM95796 TaxID=2979862 RepID=UPI0021E6DB5E|nr:FAD/NAD(P)-binding protein [Rhizobium sp. TRM95796]MCV3764738.1 FAD/NAD(P)-binding protein [Rhizobium sp. TRM95796]
MFFVMITSVAIIGSGPTGIYTLKGLVAGQRPIRITIFERESEPGKGTPYHPDMNDRAMLSNIASIELPPVCETLVDWLGRQSDATLAELGVRRDAIDVREFYPRVVLGDYFKAQFDQLLVAGAARGHDIVVEGGRDVVDIELHESEIRLLVEDQDGAQENFVFDHVVMATGHDWPETTEIKPGYFVSPWPAPILKTIPACKVGILGTSLSAIDALVTIATRHGGFLLDEAGVLQYAPSPGSDALTVTMMSRKGVLPEADFYCEFPYRPLDICTPEAVDHLVETRRHDLLDAVFDLFKRELAACDPAYAAAIGLSLQTVETIGAAYFGARESSDPFVWAAMNLAEAEANKANRHVVEWRYAILRMHEVIAKAIPHLHDQDLDRFHKYFKTLFVDDYATVPHDSIRRLLALRRAGKLTVIALGDESEIDNATVECGAVVAVGEEKLAFDAFIDATGQHPLSARDMPFPTLRQQGVIRKASSRVADLLSKGDDGAIRRTGGVDLDGAFRPIFERPLTNRLYCGSIAFLLHKLPFVQGITSARDIGQVISAAIIEEVDKGELVAA